MIITLAGTISHKTDAFIVVETAGVGYQVHMPKTALAAVTVAQPIRLWTHEHIREDARDLYGFATVGEHRLFMKLIGISGVGPKMAMNILSLGEAKDIEATIERADVDWLSSVPGVGKKTAQKIVLELRGKLALEAGGDEELITALMNLGYTREKARDAAAHANGGQAVEDRLRTALKTLATAK